MSKKPSTYVGADEPEDNGGPLFGERRFDGETFEQDKDGARLTGQLRIVLALLSDRQWWTLRRLVAEAKSLYGVVCSEGGVSARIRDLRKVRFGAHEVERRRAASSDGTHEYRMVT